MDELVDRALSRGDQGLEALRAQGLAPLTPPWFEHANLPVPPAAAAEQRSASLAMMLADPLLRRIRAASDVDILLLKGPEVAALYPIAGRRFSDVDVLSPRADALQSALLSSGFVEADEVYDLIEDHHHLPPIRFPSIWLGVEVHSEPNWPVQALTSPPLTEIYEAAVPSALDIPGVLTPSRPHHALLLAVHAWRHGPLHRIRDLLDVAVLAEGLEPRELVRTAGDWGIGRIWDTTWSAVEALFYGKPEPLALRVWATHLKPVRERTVFENHLQRWLYPYWELPSGRAFRQTVRTVGEEIKPAPGERWGTKLGRTVDAIRHPRTSAARRTQPSGD